VFYTGPGRPFPGPTGLVFFKVSFGGAVGAWRIDDEGGQIFFSKGFGGKPGGGGAQAAARKTPGRAILGIRSGRSGTHPRGR